MHKRAQLGRKPEASNYKAPTAARTADPAGLGGLNIVRSGPFAGNVTLFGANFEVSLPANVHNRTCVGRF